MSEHPTPPELEAFLQGWLPKERLRSVVRHLVHGCPSCTAELNKGRGRLTTSSKRELSEVENVAYSEAFSRSAKTARHLQLEARRAREITPLLAHGGVRAVVQDADMPLRGLGMYQALLGRSWAVRHENPHEMVRLARAAVEVAGRLDVGYYGAKRLADLQARAWGELGNALRVADDLDEADRAFGTSFELLLKGTGDPYLKVRLYDLQASFLGTRREFALAFAALDITHKIYLELGDNHLAGRSLLIKAIYTFYNGSPEEALRINRDGLRRIDETRDPDLLFQAVHNELSFLVYCGKFREARRALFENTARLGRQVVVGEVNRLKLRWLQGQISAGLLELDGAEEAFVEVKGGFESVGLGFAAALVSLDLGVVWMRQGRYRDTEDLVEEAADVFFALKIQREAISSIMILRDAFEKRQGTLVLLESVVEFLRRSQIDPDARFTPRFG